MSLAARALVVAAQQLGVREDPPGSNRGPRVDEYLRAVGLDPERSSYPWCAAFVCWCIREASGGWAEPVRWRPSASCASLVTRNQGAIIDGPEVGCVFVHLQDNGRGHCGFVTALRDDGAVETIEGNTDVHGSRTGGQVMRQVRPREYVTHWLRIDPRLGSEDDTPPAGVPLVSGR